MNMIMQRCCRRRCFDSNSTDTIMIRRKSCFFPVVIITATVLWLWPSCCFTSISFTHGFLLFPHVSLSSLSPRYSDSSSSSVYTASISSIPGDDDALMVIDGSSMACNYLTKTKYFPLPSTTTIKSVVDDRSNSAPYSYDRNSETFLFKTKRRIKSLQLLQRGRKLLFWRKRLNRNNKNNGTDNTSTITTTTTTTKYLDFSFDYDIVELTIDGNSDSGVDDDNDKIKAVGISSSSSPVLTTTTGIILIHPIGVGIGRWYYQRLIASLIKKSRQISSYNDIHEGNFTVNKKKIVIVVPDLLGSGSGCNVTERTTTATTMISSLVSESESSPINEEDRNNNNNTTVIVHNSSKTVRKFPLFNITDWAAQCQDLILSVEEERRKSSISSVSTAASTTTSNQRDDDNKNGNDIEESSILSKIDRWCIITNGGCSPIALQLAEKINTVSSTCHNSSSISSRNSIDCSLLPVVTNVILSSVPRLSFFITQNDDATAVATTPTTAEAAKKKKKKNNDPNKVAKSYRTLCGLPGKIFWWYALRNHGSFIQKFSERNLISDPMKLGNSWQSNCYQTAQSYQGKSKYSTFAFLAGTLQDGCQKSLDLLSSNNNINTNNTSTATRIDIIKGTDIRRNPARSWFWQQKQNKSGKKKKITRTITRSNKNVNNLLTSNTKSSTSALTFRDYIENNGNGGNEIMIDGRISLAHEDPDGYADAVIKFLF